MNFITLSTEETDTTIIVRNIVTVKIDRTRKYIEIVTVNSTVTCTPDDVDGMYEIIKDAIRREI